MSFLRQPDAWEFSHGPAVADAVMHYQDGGFMTELFERINAVLADRYAVEKELGAGGIVIVYLARD